MHLLPPNADPKQFILLLIIVSAVMLLGTIIIKKLFRRKKATKADASEKDLYLQFGGGTLKRLETLKEISGNSAKGVIWDALQVYEDIALDIRRGVKYYRQVPGEEIQRHKFFSVEEE